MPRGISDGRASVVVVTKCVQDMEVRVHHCWLVAGHHHQQQSRRYSSYALLVSILSGK